MGAGGVVGQSRCLGKSRPVLRLDRPGDGAPSTDATCHTLEWAGPDSGARSPAPPGSAGKTRSEEYEGHHQAHICRGRASGLLGRTWIFPLRRNLFKESSCMTQVERIATFAAA